MVRAGWVGVAERYVPGSWGPIAYVAAVFLSIGIVGIVLLYYLITVEAPGSLVVTYRYPGKDQYPLPRQPPPSAPVAGPRPPRPRSGLGQAVVDEPETKLAELLD